MEAKVNQTLENKLWQLFNQTKGRSIHTESTILWLLAIAVLAKQSHEKFQELTKLNREKKLEYVVNNGYYELKNYKFDIDSLEHILSFIREINDFALLADAVSNLLSGDFLKDSYPGFSSQIISTFVKKYVSKEKLGSVYDGAAGYCSVTSQIAADNFCLMDIIQENKAIGQGIMLLKDKKFTYESGDTLYETISSLNADLVVCEPPWGLRLSPGKRETINSGRYLLSKELENPPTSASDSLWIQNSLYHLNDKGKAFVILPHGWLFRGGYDALLRERMLELDVIEAIVGLPERSMKTTAIAPVILILNKNKKYKGLVHFVDASDMGTVDKRQVNLSDDEIQSLVDMARGKNKDEDHFKAVTLEQIAENDNTLTIKQYVLQKEVFQPFDITSEVEQLKHLTKKSEAAQQKLLGLLTAGVKN